jgi:hypothetical protein
MITSYSLFFLVLHLFLCPSIQVLSYISVYCNTLHYFSNLSSIIIDSAPISIFTSFLLLLLLLNRNFLLHHSTYFESPLGVLVSKANLLLLNVILLFPSRVKYVSFILVSHINIISFISESDILIPSERKFLFVFINNTPIIHKIYPEIRYSNRLLGCFENVKCFLKF